MRALTDYLRDPSRAVAGLVMRMGRLFPAKWYLKLVFRGNVGYRLNLKDPKTYNEKLQWIKLYDHNPLYPVLVDKYKVKKYVADKIGERYVIPLLGVWDSVEDIDWDSLPQQFVIKCSHDCAGMIICRDKSALDTEDAKKKLDKWLKSNYYYVWREWPYKDLKPVLFAEKYMEDRYGELRDYKFFCFDGEVKAMFVATGRNSGEEVKFDFFDADYNHLSLVQGHPNARVIPDKPECFEEMKRLAAVLSKGMPQVRIDLYEVDGQVFFGEFTFFHFAGMVRFEPAKWDETFGGYIRLPEKGRV